MYRAGVEEMTLSRLIIMVGRDGISLLQKGRNERFDVVVTYRWGQENTALVINSLMSHVPPAEICDVILDDNVTRIFYLDPNFINAGTSVTENFGRVSVHFFDILKNRACRLESEKSDLEELVQAFAPFFIQIRRFVLRSPTLDFRYMVCVDIATVIRKPNTWFSAISTALSSVLINRSTVEINLTESAPAQPPETALRVGSPLFPVEISPTDDDIPAINNNAPETSNTRADKSADARLSTPAPNRTGTLTLIFSSNESPVTALLAAGVVWSLPAKKDKKNDITITEVGAYRRKLISPFRKLIGVTAHQETEALPMTTARLDRLMQDISIYAKQPNDHVLYFGYEILTTAVLKRISQLLQETKASYHIVVCDEAVEQVPQPVELETAFNSFAHKSWIYVKGTDIDTVRLRHWNICETPRLDDVILKKIMQGEFRVVGAQQPPKTALTILEYNAFKRWLADFSASIANG